MVSLVHVEQNLAYSPTDLERQHLSINPGGQKAMARLDAIDAEAEESEAVKDAAAHLERLKRRRADAEREMGGARSRETSARAALKEAFATGSDIGFAEDKAELALGQVAKLQRRIDALVGIIAEAEGRLATARAKEVARLLGLLKAECRAVIAGVEGERVAMQRRHSEEYLTLDLDADLDAKELLKFIPVKYSSRAADGSGCE